MLWLATMAERGMGTGGWGLGTRMLARRRAGVGVAVMVIGGERTVENVDALMWLN